MRDGGDGGVGTEKVWCVATVTRDYQLITKPSPVLFHAHGCTMYRISSLRALHGEFNGGNAILKGQVGEARPRQGELQEGRKGSLAHMKENLVFFVPSSTSYLIFFYSSSSFFSVPVYTFCPPG